MFQFLLNNYGFSDLNEIFLAFILLLSLNYFTIIFWKLFYTRNNVYKGKQRAHLGEVPRWGGATVFIWLFAYLFLIDKSSIGSHYLELLFICLPFMIISLYEDTLHNVNAKFRLIVMIITTILITYFWLDGFPKLDHILFFNLLGEYKAFSVIFFSFALIGLMNGANFIDGMNGLAPLFFLGAFISCFFLAFYARDINSLQIILPMSLGIIVFIFFNFPLGKIFLGDSGAYIIALILGVWLIEFFSKYNQISSWNAVLILFYPIAEVSYSTIRKAFQKKSVFQPDREHLHIKIYP